MSLKLYFHPLPGFPSAAGQLPEAAHGAPRERDAVCPHIVDPGNPASSADFKKIWPIGKLSGAP
jgi:hypothetical protein